jgi:hypothetical protein
MDKEMVKRKNAMFKSMLANPKLARAYKDAINAPIGSTKREQAKSMFSVMRKMGNVNDGQGGILQDIGNNVKNFFNPVTTPTPSLTTPISSPVNYGNMIVFKAAPALKNSTPVDTSSMGLTLNAPTPSAGLTGTNIFNTPTSKSINGVVTKTPNQTFNTNPNQPLYSSTVPTITPPDSIKSMGLNLTAPITRPTSSILSGVGSTPNESPVPIPWNFKPTGTSMSTELMKSYNTPNPVPAAPVVPPTLVISPASPVATDPTKIDIIPDTNTNNTNTNTQTGINQGGQSGGVNGSIATQEGGNYSTVNKDSGALGKYQIMPSNLKAYAGLENTPENIQLFLNNSELQDKTFANMTGALNTKYNGDPALVAAAYYGGALGASNYGTAAGDRQGKYNKDGSLTGYPSVNEYVSSVLGRIGGSTNLDPNAYIAANTGSAAYGEDLAMSQFGGKNLNQVIIDDIASKKKEYGIAEAEQALSDLVAKKENIIPTLTTFIKGKDQYLSFIDKAIDQMNDSITETDMGDPAVANAYNRQLNYLYTLKGRQNERYSNFLTAASADYQADVDRATSNYNTLKTDYETAVNQKTTMDSDTYNNLMTRGAATYTEIQNAPTLKANQTALDLQNLQNAQLMATNGINQATVTDPTLNKQKLAYIDELSQGAAPNAPKIFNPNVMLAGGLGGYYQSIIDSQGNPAAVTDAIATTMKAGLVDPAATIQTVSNYVKLLKDLQKDPNPQGEVYANAIIPTVMSAAKGTISTYIGTNLKAIKNALIQLSNGPTDKNSWQSKNSGIYNFLTDALYDAVMMEPAYKANPKDGIKLFLNGTDAQIATTLTTIITG